MNVCATPELELTGLHGSRPPSVVVSYGLGLDSTCLLLRWLREPSTRDFAVEDMVVVTAMVGDEFSSTAVAVESLMLPLFREFGVRYVQCAREQRVTTAGGEGVVVLDDSTYPQKLYAEGAYRLSDEMLSAGTLPQLGGARKCSMHAKGWALDPVIAKLTAGQPYRHVIGFESGEQGRAEKDSRYNTTQRTGWYPLIEAGFDRQACHDYVSANLGVAWEKSCCSYCVFALTSARGRAAMVERYRHEPAAGARAMLIEATARRLNERQTLIAGSSVAQMVQEAGLTAVEDEFRRVFTESGFAVYDVRRVTPAGVGGRRGVTARSVHRLAMGPEDAMDAYLANSPGQRIVGSGGIVRHHLPAGPGCEHFRVVAPAVVEDKQRKGFDRMWANVNSDSLF